ncbi:MAG: TetR/AcrR family transcriptional regulator [Acidimicrobiales bacterium]
MAKGEYLGPARRRDPVLDAALEVFADGGYTAATMSTIASRAGVSKSVLYDCFPGGKQELWQTLLLRVEAAFSSHFEQVEAGITGPLLQENVAAGLRAFLSFADVNPHAFRLIYGDAGTSEPLIRAGVEAVRERTIGVLRDRMLEKAALPCDPARGREWFVRVLVAVAEELARWTLREPDLPRDLYVDLAAAWLAKGVPVGTAEVVQGFYGRAEERRNG